jgi:hypothetical protein
MKSKVKHSIKSYKTIINKANNSTMLILMWDYNAKISNAETEKNTARYGDSTQIEMKHN